jgi:hypothetical protein
MEPNSSAREVLRSKRWGRANAKLRATSLGCVRPRPALRACGWRWSLASPHHMPVRLGPRPERAVSARSVQVRAAQNQLQRSVVIRPRFVFSPPVRLGPRNASQNPAQHSGRRLAVESLSATSSPAHRSRPSAARLVKSQRTPPLLRKMFATLCA